MRLSGYLLAAPGGTSFTREDFEQKQPKTREFPLVRFIGTATVNAHWDKYEVISPISLGEEAEGEAPGPPYRYEVYIIRGASKYVLLADRRKVADYTLNYAFNQSMFPNLRKISINMDTMIARCSDEDCEFLVTSLHGRLSGPSKHLRSMSLYGDDVTKSPIYATNAELFNFYSCGIGRRLYEAIPRFTPADDGEIMRVGNDGFVSFYSGDRRKAAEFLQAVGFVVNGKWTPAWVAQSGSEL